MSEQQAKHTPGPWTFSRWNEFGDMRFYIAQADGAPHTPRYSDVATLIAETTSNEWQSIQEANAHLIAAAPELLAEVEREYINLADIHNEWPGRNKPEGQMKLGRLNYLHGDWLKPWGSYPDIQKRSQ